MRQRRHSISETYSRSISKTASMLLTAFGLIGMLIIAFSLFNTANTKLRRIQDISQVALPYPVWNYDDKTIGEFLDALTVATDIKHAQIVMDGMSIARPGPALENPSEHFSQWYFKIVQFPIRHADQQVAQVVIVQSRSALWTTIAGSLLALVLLNLTLLALLIRRSIALTDQYIFTPLQRLELAAARMAAGNLEQRLDTEGNNEIASLAKSLDSMRGAIHQLMDELHRANAELSSQNRILEQKVKERTHDLQRLNAQLNLENVRMGSELEVTRRLQEMVLPRDDELCAVEGLQISTHMEPANEVGGDYFDILNEGGRVRIGIGDVTGHGLESGVLMLLTQSAVRTLNTSEETDLSRMVEILNRSLVGNINRMGNGKNLTFALIDYRLDLHQGQTVGHLTIVGQHESVLICRAHGDVEEVDTMMLGMPIGLVEEVGEYLDEEHVTLYPGDTVVLFTDGITEAADPDNELFGMDRLKQVLRKTQGQSAQEIKQAVIDSVKEHMAGRELLDDLTLLVLQQVQVPEARVS